MLKTVNKPLFLAHIREINPCSEPITVNKPSCSEPITVNKPLVICSQGGYIPRYMLPGWGYSLIARYLRVGYSLIARYLRVVYPSCYAPRVV